MSSRSRVISLAVIAALAFAVWGTTKSRTPDGTAEAGTAPIQPAPRALAAGSPAPAVAQAPGPAKMQAQTQVPVAARAPAPAAPFAPAPSAAPYAQTARTETVRPEIDRQAGLDAGTVALWEDWRQRFLTPEGRVIDTGNGGISHSEGQGYGLLLSVLMGDRASFARIWSWTYTTLFVRDDGMMAWRYDPKADPAVTDRNSASDGDILAAWALAEAGRRWSDDRYREAAAELATAIRRTVIVEHAGRLMVLPGQEGFRRDPAVVVNPAYWVLPAFPVLAEIDPEGAAVWNRLAAETPAVMAAVRFGNPALPPEWVVAEPDGAFSLPQDPNFPAAFGYNAVRVPLYLAWAGMLDPGLPIYVDLDRLWPSGAARTADRPQVVALPEGRVTERGSDAGFRAVAGLVACIVHDRPMPADVTAVDDDASYYAASLTLMVRLAAAGRKPACL